MAAGEKINGSANPEYGSLESLLFSVGVLILILILNRFLKGFARTLSVLIGTAAAAMRGKISFSSVIEAPFFHIPKAGKRIFKRRESDWRKSEIVSLKKLAAFPQAFLYTAVWRPAFSYTSSAAWSAFPASIPAPCLSSIASNPASTNSTFSFLQL